MYGVRSTDSSKNNTSPQVENPDDKVVTLKDKLVKLTGRKEAGDIRLIFEGTSLCGHLLRGNRACSDQSLYYYLL